MSEPYDPVVECIAMAICWSEFTMHREDTPQDYWASVSAKAKNEYRSEARCYALAMRGQKWVLMPEVLTCEQITEARVVRPALRQDHHVEDVWLAFRNKRPKLEPRQ